MRPRRTHDSNCVFSLEGGTEDNDLWLRKVRDQDGGIVLCSCWVPTDDERAQIAAGANVELIVWGEGHPPVAMRVVTYPLGAPPPEKDDG
jgi:hypothetical protein